MREEVVGVQVRVAQKPESIAVNLVSSRFGDDIDRTRRTVALVDAAGRGLDGELLNRIREGERQVVVAEVVLVVASVEV